MSAASDRTGRFVAAVAPSADATAMSKVRVELVADQLTPAAETAIALCATLLLRLEDFAPVLHLRVPDGRSRDLPRLRSTSLPEALAAEHDGFGSLARFTTKPARDPDVRLVFSGTTPGVQVATSGWCSGLGVDLPGNGNDIAAAYAGVLASADALQTQLAAHGARTRRFRGHVSLWDMCINGAAGPDLPSVVSLDDTAFLACGGVASAAFWTLALLRVKGSPLLVDPDAIDSAATNLNRHLTANLANLADPKAELAATLLRAAGATPIARVEQWRPGTLVRTLVVSPDSDPVRRQAQADLPALLLNGGTSDTGHYVVSRHNFLHDACAACIARADQRDATPLAAIARRLGLKEADLAPFVTSTAPLPGEVVAAMSGLDAAERDRLRYVAGRDLIEHVCGFLRPLGSTPAVSAPMLAAAPGVLLAAEIVRASAGSTITSSSTMTSILTGPHGKWTFPRGKTAGCICTDPLYRQRYRQFWTV